MEINATITPANGSWTEAEAIIKKIRESQAAEFTEIRVKVEGVSRPSVGSTDIERLTQSLQRALERTSNKNFRE